MTAKPYTVHVLIEALMAGLPARGTVLERSYCRAADELIGFWQWRIVDCGAVYEPLDVERAYPGESHGKLLSIEPINLEVRYWRPAGTGVPDEHEADKLRAESAMAGKTLTHKQARDQVRAATPGEWTDWAAADLSYGVLFSHVRVVPAREASGDPTERGELDVEPMPPIAGAVRR